MDHNHMVWNKNQHRLQTALANPENHPEWLDLFLRQHGQVHSSQVYGGGEWYFEDEVLDGMDDHALRTVRGGSQHSIAWILWHLARIEDLTMNMLVAGTSTLFERDRWAGKLNAPFTNTGNEIDAGQVNLLNQTIQLENLRAYRVAVGQHTQQLASQLTAGELRQKVSGERIQRIRASGAVVPAADGIVNYWSRRTIAGLLLMPPTRHCFTHLNEALRIKHSLKR
jgi:hypothetical protein